MLEPQIFQPWFLELSSFISDAIVGASALAVAIIAFWGLRQWKAELTGRTKFDLARKMAVLAFEFRDRYKRARTPITLSVESSERQIAETETREETDLLNEHFAHRKRLGPIQETLSRLYEAGWEAEIILDKDIGKLIQPLDSAFQELYASIETYFGSEYSRINRHIPAERKEEWLIEHFHRIYGLNDNESKAIDAATQSLVNKLKTYL